MSIFYVKVPSLSPNMHNRFSHISRAESCIGPPLHIRHILLFPNAFTELFLCFLVDMEIGSFAPEVCAVALSVEAALVVSLASWELVCTVGCVVPNTFFSKHGAPMIFHCSRTLED